MKKRLIRILVSALVLVAMTISDVSWAPTQVYAATSTVKVKGKYYQSDARKMKKMINNFRTGDEAWYYKTEGSYETVVVEGLGKLKYDYELEKIAMQRAAEITVCFDHTRPNGKSFSSLYPSTYKYMGENIAMGTSRFMGRDYMGTEETMELWKETDESYSGQGHRRNMLYRNYTSVGIACFEVDGVKYWVQEFGSPNSKAEKTKACNKKKTVKVEVLE